MGFSLMRHGEAPRPLCPLLGPALSEHPLLPLQFSSWGISEDLGEAQGKQNPGDPAASLSSPAALSADGLTSGISIKTSTVAAAGSVPESWASLLGATHCHRGRAPASQRCMAVSHAGMPDSGRLLLSGLLLRLFPHPSRPPRRLSQGAGSLPASVPSVSLFLGRPPIPQSLHFPGGRILLSQSEQPSFSQVPHTLLFKFLSLSLECPVSTPSFFLSRLTKGA